MGLTGSGVGLTADEVVALAKFLVARQAGTDWLEWGDVPELSESTFDRLRFAVQQEVLALHAASDRHDRTTGIDSRYLFGRAT